MSRMRREVFNDYGVPLCEAVSEVPAPKGSEVLVRVGHCGVCHSDIHLHEGYFDLGGGRARFARAARSICVSSRNRSAFRSTAAMRRM